MRMPIAWITLHGDVICHGCATRHQNGTEGPRDPVFHGAESDTPQHCHNCEELLEYYLTHDGVNYVLEALSCHMADGQGRPDILDQWAEHVKYSLHKDDTDGYALVMRYEGFREGYKRGSKEGYAFGCARPDLLKG